MFELSRESAMPLVEQICERLTQLVRHGQLSPGTRLPSIRRLARQIGASPFTVVDAYERLVARGLIESRAGRGFFVTQRRLSAPLAAVEALPDPGSDALALASMTLSLGADLIPAGSGFLPENWLLEAVPAGVLARLVKNRRMQPWLPCPPQHDALGSVSAGFGEQPQPEAADAPALLDFSAAVIRIPNPLETHTW